MNRHLRHGLGHAARGAAASHNRGRRLVTAAVQWDMAAATLDAGDIDSVGSGAAWRVAAPQNGATPYSVGAAVFNGASGSRVLGVDYSTTAVFDSVVALPDATSAGSEGVTGFTGVGANVFPDGKAAFGNFGLQRYDSAVPRTPGWVEIDPSDLSTVIADHAPTELRAPEGGANGVQLQGLAVGRLDRVFLMGKNTDTVYIFERSGDYVGAIDVSGDGLGVGDGNALVYFPQTDHVAVCDETSNTWYCYAAEDGGAYAGSFVNHAMGSGTVDQAFLSGSVLLWGKGSNGSAAGGGSIYYQEMEFSSGVPAVKTNGARGRATSVAQAEAIEGFFYLGGKLFVVSDPGFHSDAAPYTYAYNNVTIYDALPPLPAYGSAVSFGFVSDLAANGTGGAVAILATPGSASNTEWAIYQGSTNNLIVYLRDLATSTLLGFNWTVDLTGPHRVVLRVDLEANSATLDIDGEDRGPPTVTNGTLAGYAGGIGRGALHLGGADENGTWARFLSGRVFRVAVDASDARVRSALAFRAGEASLPEPWAQFCTLSMRTANPFYDGPLIQIINTAGETLDVSAGADGWADEDEVIAHAGKSQGVYLAKTYDQSGNGRDVTYPSGARPTLVHPGGRPHLTPSGRLVPYFPPGAYGSTSGASWPGGEMTVSAMVMTLTDSYSSADTTDTSGWSVFLTSSARTDAAGFVFGLSAPADPTTFLTTGGDLVAYPSGRAAAGNGNARIADWNANARGFQSLCYSASADGVTVDFNGEQQSLTASAAGLTAAHSQEILIGDPSSGPGLWRGWPLEVVIGRRAFTQQNRDDVWSNHFPALYGDGTVVLLSGSSLAAAKLEAIDGYHAGMLLAGAVRGGGFSVAPFGRAGGWDIDDMTVLAPSCEDAVAAKAVERGQDVWLIYHEYWNDRYRQKAASDAAYSARCGAFCDARRASGVSRVFAYPQVTFGDANNLGDNDNTTLAAYNAVLEADDWHDDWIDLSAFSLALGDPTDTRFWRSDQLHPERAGTLALTIAAAQAILGAATADVVVSTVDYLGDATDVAYPSAHEFDLDVAPGPVFCSAVARANDLTGLQVDFTGEAWEVDVQAAYVAGTGISDNVQAGAYGVAATSPLTVSVTPIDAVDSTVTTYRAAAAAHSLSGAVAQGDVSGAGAEFGLARVRFVTVRAARSDLVVLGAFGNEIDTVDFLGASELGGVIGIENGRSYYTAATGAAGAYGSGFLTFALIAPADGTNEKHLSLAGFVLEAA